ncbi:MAG: hypothetical protein NTY19_07600 [Planctomycetota bacterium]|nr:hypothetical protein [Planctomycetota bacterium]
MQSQHRQFSLRKLMLWIAVLAICLGFVRLVPTEFVIHAVFLVVWLPLVLTARLLCGDVRGLVVATYGTMCFAAVVVLVVNVSIAASLGWSNTPVAWLLFIASIALFAAGGFFLGVVGFVATVLASMAVDWVDDLIAGWTGHPRHK